MFENERAWKCFHSPMFGNNKVSTEVQMLPFGNGGGRTEVQGMMFENGKG